MNRLFALILLSALIVLTSISTAAAYRTQNISNSPFDSEVPKINDNKDILYIQKNADGNSDLFLYSYSNRKISQLTNNANTENDYQLGQSGHVVWCVSAISGYDIFIYDSQSDMTKQITSNYYNDRSPQVNASGQVVWHGDIHSNNQNEIFLYDHASGESIQLTSNALNDNYPQINNNGEVSWSGGTGNDDVEIYLAKSCTSCHSFPSGETPYDGHATIQVTNNDSYDGGTVMNNNGQIVWTGCAGETDACNFELFLYDIASQNTVRLTNNTFSDSEQKINDRGNIVWQQYDGSDLEIFYTKSCTQCHAFPSDETPYDGHATVQLSDNSYDEQDPQINRRGQVIWPREVTWGDYRLMTYKDGSSVKEIPLPDFSEKLWKPMINAFGDIVWEDYDRTAGEDEEMGASEIYFMKHVSLSGVMIELLLNGN